MVWIPRVLFVCTGNAARSVMAATMFAARYPDASAAGAGTHSIEGLPMSQRTRRALDAHGLSNPDHLSHQLTAEDADSADLIAVFEPNHINFVRRQHPTAAHKTAPLPWWARSLPSAPFEDRAAFANWLLPHALDQQPIDPADEVIDPAGGEQDVFDASAHEIAELIDTLAARLSADGA